MTIIDILLCLEMRLTDVKDHTFVIRMAISTQKNICHVQENGSCLIYFNMKPSLSPSRV